MLCFKMQFINLSVILGGFTIAFAYGKKILFVSRKQAIL